MTPRHRSLLLVVVPALTASAPLQAQRGVDANALLGYYRPTGSFDPTLGYSAGLPTTPAQLQGAFKGGEVRVWLGRHWGLQALVGFARSTIAGPSAPAPGGAMLPPRRALVGAYTVETLYNLARAPRGVRVWLGAGPALVKHGGLVYAGYGPTSLGGALGAGASVRLGPGFRALAGAGALLYPFTVETSPRLLVLTAGPVQKGFRRDLEAHVGLGWGLP